MVTSTVTQTTKTTLQQTVTATPASFYLQVGNSNTSVDGMYGLVNGETMDFVAGTDSASKFYLATNGSLISRTNGWIANMQQGTKYSTLFFDSAALIQQDGLVAATCGRTTGNLQCTDQNATSLYYCESFGAELVIASPSYQGYGCKNVTLNTINA